VVASRREGEGNDVAAYQEQMRHAFRRIEATLTAAGVHFRDVVLLNTFHDWQVSPFHGDRMAQFTAFGAVKDEFIKEPYPAWTAVGTSSLIPDGGLVEIQVIAHVATKDVAVSRRPGSSA
jgi:enamine deaminase RidA (YjgF/YER057c/UK114 family)